ncbi:hypothetical protein BH23ACT9_BH23ACT9_16780 [soil metagenome]
MRRQVVTIVDGGCQAAQAAALLGLLRGGDGLAAQILVGHGITLSGVDAAIGERRRRLAG